MKRLLLISGVVFWILSAGYAQNSDLGKPFLKNYTHKDYLAHTQNFGITQDNLGIMYFANFIGVLEYDGTIWKTLSTNDISRITSIVKDTKGRIYVGASSDFGYLMPQKPRCDMQFISLKDSLKQFGKSDIEIVTVCIINNLVYYIATDCILSWDGKSLKMITQISSEKQVLFAFATGSQLYVMLKNSGIFTLNNNDLVEVSRSKNTGQILDVSAMIKLDNETLIICTANQGLLAIRNNSIDTLYSPMNSYFRRNTISCGIKLSDGTLAIGTERGGIILLDGSLHLKQVINKESGLQNEHIRALYQANDGRLWAALNNGISQIDVQGVLTYFDQNYGITGEINGTINYNGTIYFYGTDGIFTRGARGFEPINGITSACWNIIECNNQLLAATSKGIFRLNKQNVITQLSNNFSLALCRSKFDSTKIFIGEIDHLALLEVKRNNWIYQGAIAQAPKEIRKILEDEYGNLWLEISAKHVYRYNIQQMRIEKLDSSNKLPPMVLYYLNTFNKQILINTTSGTYTFDNQTAEFQPFKLFNDSISPILHRLSQSQDSVFYANQWDETNVAMYIKNEEGKFVKHQQILYPICDMNIWNISPQTNGVVWFSGPQGVIRFDSQKKHSSPVFNAIIREIQIGSDSLIFEGTYFDNNYISTLTQNSFLKYKIDYKLNTIRFKFTATSYDVKGECVYQCYLDGYDKIWSNWSSQTTKEYTNLPAGEYVFRVKAKNSYQEESKECTYTFKITTPLSRRWYSIVLYVIIFGVSVFAFIRYRLKKLQSEKEVLENVIQDRTKEIVSQKEEIEKQSIELGLKNNELERINTIVQSINSEIHFSNLLQSILEKLRIIRSLEIAYIYLYDEQSMSFKIMAIYGFELAEVKSISMTIDEINRIYLSDSDEIFEDIYHTNHIKFETNEKMMLLPRTKSAMVIVINIANTTQGFIVLANKRIENAFDKRDFSLAKNLKEHLVSAVIKTKMLEDIQESNVTLTEQNNIITHQKQNITDSIIYARRIQNAVITPEAVLASMFAEYFILFKPRDIVSGDFYWMKQVDDCKIIVAADCTGHGVPGAFMSMLGISFLNAIVGRLTINKANLILNELRTQVKTALRQTGKELENKDGMDISLCIIDTNKMTLQFAGAYNSAYLVRTDSTKSDKAELIELKADKMPIGIYIVEKESFTNREIEIQKGDTLYLFSDGYCDQFGGTNGQKFMTKRFREMVTNISQNPLSEQKTFIEQTFENWRGTFEQIDDVMVMGVRI